MKIWGHHRWIYAWKCLLKVSLLSFGSQAWIFITGSVVSGLLLKCILKFWLKSTKSISYGPWAQACWTVSHKIYFQGAILECQCRNTICVCIMDSTGIIINKYWLFGENSFQRGSSFLSDCLQLFLFDLFHKLFSLDLNLQCLKCGYIIFLRILPSYLCS